MQKSGDLLTVDTILETLRLEGYQLSKRTFQYYVQAGLLPKGIRKGSVKGGVRFFYPSSVPAQVRLIFTLKGRGFKLNEIREHLNVSAAELGESEDSGESVVELQGESVKAAAGQSPPVAATEAHTFYEDLYNQIMKLTPNGEALKLCLHCGTCGGSCPSANDMDYTPRKLFALLQAGYYEEVLASNTAWFCISCYYCTVRCPQQIPITEIMYTVKELAVQAGIIKITDAYDVSRIYVNLLEKYGRSFDMGYAFRYHLTSTPASTISWGSLALKHYKKERVVTGPSRIKNMAQLQRIIAKAKNMEKRAR